MTQHEFRLSRAKILAELQTAERLGCKRVIADCKHRLQELETKRFQEQKKSSRYEGPSFEDVLHDDSLLPSMKFIVTFDNGCKAEMECYNKPAIGLKRQEVEQDFVDAYNATRSAAAPVMVKAHFLPLRGGRKSDWQIYCQRVNERFEALQLERRYRKEAKVCT